MDEQITLDKRAPITVTELNTYMKMLVSSDEILTSVAVRGEISNFINHRSGHFYFSLKDEGGLIKAVMFRSSASKLNFLPENGMKVIATGRVDVFVRDGQYQFYADALEPDGVGSLYIAFEQLKKKLEAKGLFDDARKKPLPKIPLRVGIITSPTGAAIRDMINISKRRFPAVQLILYPSLVQGDGAPKNLIAGIGYFNDISPVDVIIIGRGGGSLEDLWAFNDENLAYAVSGSKIPVISAVGHETDFTICDFVADKRAPTPSAAAELALPETNELKQKINHLIVRERDILSRRITERRASIERLASSRSLKNPRVFIDDKRMSVLSLSDKLAAAGNAVTAKNRLKLSTAAAKLDALSPMAVVSRGYSVVYDKGGSVVKSVGQLEVGDRITFTASDGSVGAEVKTINKDNGENNAR